MSALPHIFLTGFMGSGKTTLGEKLAQHLNINFIDLDHFIEKKENKTILEIFENQGEETFRVLEKQALHELAASKEPAVIALGGGTICYNDNLNLAKKNGMVVYLELTAEQLCERLKKNKQNRPLLKDLDDEMLLEHITLKLKERCYFYKQANMTVNCHELSPQTLNQKIIDYKKQNKIY